MEDEKKKKPQSIEELTDAHQRGQDVQNDSDAEHWRVEKALQHTKESLLTTLHSIGDAIIVTDKAGHVVIMNPVAERLTGWKETEATGRPLDEVFHIINEETHRMVEDPVARVLREGVVIGLANHTLLIAKDGREIPIADSGAPIQDEEGRVTGVVLVFRDQTKAREAQRAAQEAREYAESIVATVREPLVILDAQLKVISANRSFYQTFEVDERETVGRYLYDLGSRQWDIPELKELLEKILPQNSSFSDFEVEHDFERIGKRTMLLNARRIHREANKTQMILLAIEDITERKRTKEALRETEKHYRTIVEHSQSGIFTLDDAYHFTYVNDVVCRILNRSHEEIIGHDFRKFLDDESRDIVVDRYIRRQRGERIPSQYEFCIVRPDGEKRQVGLIANVIQDSTGKIQTIGQILDITERKRAEEALRRSRERYYSLFNGVPIGLYRTTPDGKILDANQALVDMLGYPTRELLLAANTTDLYVDPNERQQEQTLLKQEGLTLDFKTRLRRRDGRIIWTRDRARLVRTEDGAVQYFEGSLEDITTQVQAEEERARQAAVIEQAGESIVITDLAGTMIYVNPFFEKLTGYSVTEAVGQNPRILKSGYQDEAFYQNLWDTITSGRVWHGVFVNKRKDQSLYYERATIFPVRNSQGMISYYAAVKQNITAQIQAEKELRESRQMLQLVLDTIPVRVFWKDRSLHYLGCNRAFALDAGLSSPEEIVGKDDFELVWRDQAKMYRADDRAVMESQLPKLNYEEPETTPSGDTIWLRTNKVPLVDASGQVKGVLGTCEDITEHKRAEEALHSSEARLRAITESAQDAILMVDPAGNVSFWNQAAERIFGYTKEEALGQNMGKLIVPPHYYKAHRDAIVLFQEGGRGNAVGKTMEVDALRKDGRQFPVELSLSALELDDGWYGVGIMRDITERKRAEEERVRLTKKIQEQARQVEQVLATVPEGVLLLDAEGRVIQANPRAEGDLAVLANAKVGDRLTHLGDRSLAELLTSPPTKGLWHEVKTGNRTFEVIARPMSRNVEATYWVLVINDVTREREIQAELQQQERLAAVGQLAAGIAHDFNNILAIIILYTYMGLQIPDIPAKLRERLQTISQQAHRAADLIQQILDFSRRSVLERRPMDLTPFLKEMIKMLERTIPEDIELKFTYGTDEYIVNADLTRVQQAIMNLVVNARDAMPKGGKLHIALSRISETDEIRCVTCGTDPLIGKEWIRIAVTDTGDGIPPDVLPHIFEPFFTTKAVGKGTGLGLAQVYGIVKQHGGHLDVTTKAGEGTTFAIYLPAFREHRPGSDVVETETFIQGRGELILVVEDDATLREALVDTLALLNYRAIEAANGHEALAILAERAEEINLVLSDLVMPGMGGQALFRAMRQRDLTLPVVMLSGHAKENELKRLQAQGLAGWMLKPPSLEKLSQLLARVLNG